MKKLICLISVFSLLALAGGVFALEPQYLEIVGTAGSLAMSFQVVSDGQIDFGSREFSIDLDHLSISTPAEVQTVKNTGSVPIDIGMSAEFSGPWTSTTEGPTTVGVNIACTDYDPESCATYPGGTFHPTTCLQPDTYDMRTHNLQPGVSFSYVFRLTWPTVGSDTATETITYTMMAVATTP